MRIALVVGIDYYVHGTQLHGCVNDAYSVSTVLERHGDGTLNFDCNLKVATSEADALKRGELKDEVEKLFRSEADIALFYFAGHGHIEAAGGYLLTSEANRGDEGMALAEVLALANKSRARNKVIVLDSCHSGIAGNAPTSAEVTTLAEGMTVLTASTADQYASEENGRGVFTSLFVDALHGGAANLTGDISPGSIYAHIDQSLGGWEQRPLFKTNVRHFVSLRRVQPPIALEDLRRITELFPDPAFEYPLDPSYEPEMKGRDADMPPPDPENTRTFAVLQKYNRLNLLAPVDVPHMWNAAMESRPCKLKVLGQHYWRLVKKRRI